MRTSGELTINICGWWTKSVIGCLMKQAFKSIIFSKITQTNAFDVIHWFEKIIAPVDNSIFLLCKHWYWTELFIFRETKIILVKMCHYNYLVFHTGRLMLMENFHIGRIVQFCYSSLCNTNCFTITFLKE